MNHNSERAWLMAWPFEQTVVGVIHELRMPYNATRNALTLLKHERVAPWATPHFDAIDTLLNQLQTDIDHLFLLRAYSIRTGGDGGAARVDATVTRVVEDTIGAMHATTTLVQQHIIALQDVMPTTVEPFVRQLVEMATTNARASEQVIDTLLVHGLLERLRLIRSTEQVQKDQ